MNLKDLEALAEHAMHRIAHGEKAAILIEGMPYALTAQEITVNTKGGTLDILTEDGEAFYRIDLARIVGLRLAKTH